MSDDGFRFWPACPTCSAPLSCIGREPENAVPADVYRFVCATYRHESCFTRKEILAMQAQREQEVLE